LLGLVDDSTQSVHVAFYRLFSSAGLQRFRPNAQFPLLMLSCAVANQPSYYSSLQVP
jgi:hypothetical protein